MRTIPNISQNLKQLDKNIRNCFVKTLFNGYKCNAIERKRQTDRHRQTVRQAASQTDRQTDRETETQRELLKLPAKFDGLGIVNPSKLSDCDYRNSHILMQRKKDHKSS